jgi:hypothetical protein
MNDLGETGYQRFAGWSRMQARLLAAAFVVLLVASALVPIRAGPQVAKRIGFVEAVAGGVPAKQAERPRDDDLALYDRVIARIGKGESYYPVVAEEHRRSHYPLRPGLAVRLPTLAYFAVWLGDPGKGADVFVPGEMGLAIVLAVAVIWAWWRRLGEEPGGYDRRLMGAALVFFGASLGLNRYFFVLHELWAGMLVALALALHRPGRKYWAAVLVAALALAIREHVLPFVLLMAALAAWRRDWKEMAAWCLPVVLFAVGLAWHLTLVAQQVLPSDPVGPSWIELRGLSGFLSNVVLFSNLRFLPHYVAGPIVMLAMLGWAAWKSPLGTTATLLFSGYALAFAIAGRPDNFYWGGVIAPALFVGLAFVPMAVKSLIGAVH